MSYEIGARRKLVGTITVDGEVVDADELLFQIRTPDGEITTYTEGTDAQIVRASEGVYHVFWDCEQTGNHYWWFVASGDVAAVTRPKNFRVNKTRFPTPE